MEVDDQGEKAPAFTGTKRQRPPTQSQRSISLPPDVSKHKSIENVGASQSELLPPPQPPAEYEPSSPFVSSIAFNVLDDMSRLYEKKSFSLFQYFIQFRVVQCN
jgi:hypothetical protein